MSIKALDWAMDAPVNDPLAKLVLIVVANHHNDARGVGRGELSGGRAR